MKLRTSSTWPLVNCRRLLCSQPYSWPLRKSSRTSHPSTLFSRESSGLVGKSTGQLASSAGAAAGNRAHGSEWLDAQTNLVFDRSD